MSIMNKLSKIVYILLTLSLFITFDVYFSNVLVNNSSFFENNPIFDLVYVKNTGAAFSLLENFQIFLIIFAVLAILLILFYLFKHIEKITTFACLWSSMLIAGISCNMYERIVFGYVRDFFKLNFIDFPVFNISDIFINVGVLALIVIIIKNKYLKK